MQVRRITGRPTLVALKSPCSSVAGADENVWGRFMWRFAWQNLITRPTRTLLAVVGLTIPIIAILGLFSLTNGIRTLMGNTLAKMNGLMVMRANSPAPVFSDLPETMVDDLRKIPGTRIVAPEVWKICSPDRRAQPARTRGHSAAHGQGRPAVQLVRRDDHDRRECSFPSIST